MDENKLYELIERYVYDNRNRAYIGGREKLSILLNYKTFNKMRHDLYNQTSFLTHNAKQGVFMYAGVIVSWSPLVEEEDGYIFGRTDLF